MKGVRDLVRALDHLRDLQGIELDVVGDGEDRLHCEAEARELGLLGRIRFWGRVPRERVDDFYSRADAFVFPSICEPSGNVVVEALGHGLPVVACDRGGPGFVVDDSCGIRVSAKSPDQYARDLSRAIRSLYESPSQTAELARGARKRAEGAALWPKKIDWLTDLYFDVIGSGSVGR